MAVPGAAVGRGGRRGSGPGQRAGVTKIFRTRGIGAATARLRARLPARPPARLSAESSREGAVRSPNISGNRRRLR